MYQLKFAAYCGMVSELCTSEDVADIRAEAADILRYARRKGEPVVTLEPGKRWEFLEPEDAIMVPDSCGEMYVAHHVFTCRECGSEYENHGDAMDCCRF